jgi:hypothetical protein
VGSRAGGLLNGFHGRIKGCVLSISFNAWVVVIETR